MLNATYWIVLVLLIFSIFELLRRNVLREKYAVVWIGLGLMLILGAFFPSKVNQLSYWLGFQYLSNFVLFFLLIINLLISMQLTLSVGKSENQIHALAEELAILNFKANESNKQ
jgi:hypothetical protein